MPRRVVRQEDVTDTIFSKQSWSTSCRVAEPATRPPHLHTSTHTHAHPRTHTHTAGGVTLRVRGERDATARRADGVPLPCLGRRDNEDNVWQSPTRTSRVCAHRVCDTPCESQKSRGCAGEMSVATANSSIQKHARRNPQRGRRRHRHSTPLSVPRICLLLSWWSLQFGTIGTCTIELVVKEDDGRVPNRFKIVDLHGVCN